ncbi:MAG: hypothetical protein D6776_05975 [Planctomycetota bacterium]|nr:MAG: hypothetical protein D6776_05975 [Planctomycetota bacterium]
MATEHEGAVTVLHATLACAASTAQIEPLLASPEGRARWLPAPFADELALAPQPDTSGSVRYAATLPAGDAAEGARIELQLEPCPEGGSRLVAHLALARQAPDNTDEPATPEPLAAELAARWRWRLEALRTAADSGASLEAVGAQLALEEHALCEDAIELERSFACHPRELYAALGPLLAAGEEAVLSAAPERQVVSLRLPDGGAAAPGIATRIERTIERKGSGCRLRIRQQGFSSGEPWWSLEQRLRWVPSLALSRRAEQARLERQLAQLDEQLADRAIRLRLEIAAPAEAVERAVSRREAVGLWLPGWHEGSGETGERFVWRPFAHEPWERPDRVETPPWPAVRGIWLERAQAQDLRDSPWNWRRVARLEADTTATPPAQPGALLGLEARGGEGAAPTTLELTLTGAAQEAAERDAIAARWRRRLEALRDALEGRLTEKLAVRAPRDELFVAAADPAQHTLWLDRGAHRAGATLRYPGHPDPATGGATVAQLRERTPPERLRMTWPPAAPGHLPPPELLFRCETPEGSGGASSTLHFALTDVGADTPERRLERLATERARWRWRLLGLRATAETGLGWIDPRAFAPTIGLGPASIRLEIEIAASAPQVHDWLLSDERPLFEIALTGGQALEIEPLPSGGWSAPGAEGQLLRLLPEREIEYTVLFDDAPQHPTVVRWLLLPGSDDRRCRVRLEERGFGTDDRSEQRRVRRARGHRFALLELALRAAGGTLVLPGVPREVAGLAVTAERRLPASCDELWRHWTEPARLQRWLARAAQIDPRPGGALRLEGGAGALPPVLAGRVVQCEPPHRLSWAFPSTVDASPQWLQVAIEPQPDGAHLRLRHVGFATERPGVAEQRARWASPDSGWPWLLERLAAALAGRS